MSFTEKLKSLRTAPNAMATLTYSEGTDVFLMNEEALAFLSLLERLSEKTFTIWTLLSLQLQSMITSADFVHCQRQ